MKKLKEFVWTNNIDDYWHLNCGENRLGFIRNEGEDFYCESLLDDAIYITSLPTAKAWVEETVHAEIESLFEEEV